jgi:hypothetical protein
MPSAGQQPLAIVEKAKMDLARRLGVDPRDFDVVYAGAVTWPDGSLGCPQPGMSYAGSMVDGSKVLLGYDGRVYDYRAGDDNAPFLCSSDENGGGREFVPPPGFND